MADSRPSFTLNTRAITGHFLTAATNAADEAAQRGLARIQKHAPVRKLFRGTTYRLTDFGGVPVQHRFRTSSTVGGKAVARHEYEPGQTREAITGHANSEVPVFKFRTPKGTILASGDLRRIDQESTFRFRGGRIRQVSGRLPTVTVRAQIRQSGSVRSLPPLHVRIDQLRDAKNKRLLTARGSFEVRSGRAAFRSPETGLQIGGRLKGELYVEKARYEAGHVWAYVVSPTTDPETGYHYPAAMEFGSAHNRPHPFMRPGLQETRGDLVSAAKRHVRAGSIARNE